MIKKERIYIKDIANAKFTDRFFYYLLNHLKINFSGRSYATINPLKWSMMTFAFAFVVLLFYMVIVPLIGIPAVAYDAYKMPKKHAGEDDDWFVENVWLIRDIDN